MSVLECKKVIFLFFHVFLFICGLFVQQRDEV